MTSVLVTGGSGYVGTHVIATLLRSGRPVRATVRSLSREPSLRAAVGPDTTGLTVVEADLNSDDGWAAAVDGCAEIHHVASPIPVAQPANPDDLIVPARDGTLRVLRAARAAGARRVVLTSSFAAIGYTPKPVADFTEDDWTEPDQPGLPPYPRSKTIAERAAWAFDLSPTELVVINPTFILGPTLTTALGSSMQMIKMLLERTMTTVPRQRFGVADVRDVADLHLLAMSTPSAAGKRFLAVSDSAPMTFADLATALGVTVAEAPGPEPATPTIHNTRAKSLGWHPRPARTTIQESAESLTALGLLNR